MPHYISCPSFPQSVERESRKYKDRFRLKDCRNDSFMGIFGSMTIIYLMSKNVGILDFSEIFQEKKLYCSLIEIILLRRFYSKSEGLF